MPQVFVWRAVSSIEMRGTHACPYCYGTLKSKWIWGEDDLHRFDFRSLDEHMRSDLESYYVGDTETTLLDAMLEALRDDWLNGFPVRATCIRCGWWKQGLKFGGLNANSTGFAALRDFDINDPQMAIREIRAHLERRFDDVYSLAPRRFEEVIQSVYESLGWSVTLTKQTRDGGIDLFCLQADSGRSCIVECKRYARNRAVSISAIDRLLGVKVRVAADEAHFVTSSRFSQPAVAAKQQATRQGFTMRLVDGHELLQTIRAYAEPTTTLPDIRAIFGENDP